MTAPRPLAPAAPSTAAVAAVAASSAASQHVARRLGELLRLAPEHGPRLEPFDAASAPPARVAAVDGSSTVLAASGAFLVGAYRAAVVRVSHDARPAIDAPPPTLTLLEPGVVPVEVRERLADAGYEEKPASPEQLLHALRELEELEAARRVLDALGRGDALLLDGPVRHLPFPRLVRALLERAREREVDVVGVCKSTSLTVGTVPALAACHLAARQARVRRWHVELLAPKGCAGRVFVAALSPAEARAFRFDVVAHDDDAVRALASLCPLARHPGYPGYPSPLAVAHQAVILNEDTRRRLAALLAEEALRHGVTEDAWRAAFEDYHDLLDLGV